MRTPLDLKRSAPPHSLPTADPQNYPEKLRKILDQIHQEIREQTKLRAERMKKRYDQELTTSPFKAGDTVCFYNVDRRKSKATKLMPPWNVSFTVQDIINDCVARIKNPASGKLLVVHMDKLAAYSSSSILPTTCPRARSTDAGRCRISTPTSVS